MKKEIVGIFVCMLLVGTMFPVAANVIIYNNNLSLTNGNILYVGGTGEGNFTVIQDAINDSDNGDTVFVYDDSSPYLENLIVDKSINLIGEDKNTTVIQGLYVKNTATAVIQIKVDFVSIQGFTIKGFVKQFWEYGNYYGIHMLSISDNNNLINNIIKNTIHGIFLGEDGSGGSNDNIIMENTIEENNMAGILCEGRSSNNIISYNTIRSSNAHGIFLRQGDGRENVITNNNIYSNGQIGIWIGNSDSNVIKHNNIHSNGHDGISLYGSDYNIIQYNNINNNLLGILMEYSYQNDVSKNNIFDNKKPIRLYGPIWDYFKGNLIDSNIINANYWGQERINPKPIFGIYTILFYVPVWLTILYDSDPASEPYDIEV